MLFEPDTIGLYGAAARQGLVPEDLTIPVLVIGGHWNGRLWHTNPGCVTGLTLATATGADLRLADLTGRTRDSSEGPDWCPHCEPAVPALADLVPAPARHAAGWLEAAETSLRDGDDDEARGAARILSIWPTPTGLPEGLRDRISHTRQALLDKLASPWLYQEIEWDDLGFDWDGNADYLTSKAPSAAETSWFLAGEELLLSIGQEPSPWGAAGLVCAYLGQHDPSMAHLFTQQGHTEVLLRMPHAMADMVGTSTAKVLCGANVSAQAVVDAFQLIGGRAKAADVRDVARLASAAGAAEGPVQSAA